MMKQFNFSLMTQGSHQEGLFMARSSALLTFPKLYSQLHLHRSTLFSTTSSRNSIVTFPCILSGSFCFWPCSWTKPTHTLSSLIATFLFEIFQSLFSGSILCPLDIVLLSVISSTLRTIQSSVLNFSLILSIIFLCLHMWCLPSFLQHLSLLSKIRTVLRENCSHFSLIS